DNRILTQLGNAITGLAEVRQVLFVDAEEVGVQPQRPGMIKKFLQQLPLLLFGSNQPAADEQMPSPFRIRDQSLLVSRPEQFVLGFGRQIRVVLSSMLVDEIQKLLGRGDSLFDERPAATSGPQSRVRRRNRRLFLGTITSLLCHCAVLPGVS